MQIGNQMFMATDWVSLHREGMMKADKTAVTSDVPSSDGEKVSFKDTFERTRGSRITDKVNGTRKAPYSHLANENNEIIYNGVTFYCDFEKNCLCLGDVSNKKNCITVGLSGGGSLIVNRDNLDDLSRAIGMFSPEDVNLIMRAISQDAMCQRKLKEIDDMEDGVCETEETAEEGAEDTAEPKIIGTEETSEENAETKIFGDEEMSEENAETKIFGADGGAAKNKETKDDRN